MKKLNITQVGTPKTVTTKFGDKEKNFIKAKEYGENYLNYWVNAQTKGWKIGDEIEVEDVTSREYNGKTYYDVILPKNAAFPAMKIEFMALKTQMDSMTVILKQIRDHLSGKNPLNVTSNGTKIPDFSEVDEQTIGDNW